MLTTLAMILLAQDWAAEAFKRLDANDLDGALEAARKLVEAKPADAAARELRAEVHLRRGEFPQAVADLDASLKIAPDRYAPLSARAYARGMSGDFKGVVADAERLVTLEPKRSEGYVNLANGLLGLRNAEGARLACVAGLKVDPENSFLFYFRACARRWDGDLKGALEDFDAAAARKVPSFPAALSAAIVKVHMGREAEAIPALRAEIGTVNNGLYPALWIWVLEAKSGRKEADAALMALPGDAAKDPFRRVAAFLTGDVPEKDLLAAVEKEPAPTRSDRLGEAWFFIGHKRLADGDRPGAKEAFRKAQEGWLMSVEPAAAKIALKALGD